MDLEALPKTKTNETVPDDVSLHKGVVANNPLSDVGAQRIEIIQQVWGRHGKWLLYAGMALCMIVYELDNTTFSTYYVYALSDFNKTSASSALAVAINLCFSLLKPVWAKASDLFGRGEMYPVATLVIGIGYIVAASAHSFGSFAAGTILRAIGLTGINSINTILIADTTSARQRGFGVNFQFFPYLVLPWVAAEIINSVMATGGIGWHWGVGIIGIVFPVGMVLLIAVTLIYQRRAKRLEAALVGPRPARPALTAVCAHMDLGGLVLLIISLAFILLPLALASLQTHGYRTPWVIVLMILGGVGLLVGFPLYEQRVATHPFFPVRYATHRAIGIACLLYFTDYMAAEASHGYLYNWAIIAQNLTIVQATNLSYIRYYTQSFKIKHTTYRTRIPAPLSRPHCYRHAYRRGRRAQRVTRRHGTAPRHSRPATDNDNQQAGTAFHGRQLGTGQQPIAPPYVRLHRRL